MNQYCSPATNTSSSKNSRGKPTTCFSYEMLLVLARLYNQAHPPNKHIALPSKGGSRNKGALWSALKDRLDAVCGSNEACWVKQPFVTARPTEHNALDAAFRPEQPENWKANPHEWLNTYDIIAVMNQYEAADKSFMFAGVFPVDFAAKPDGRSCVSREMCTLDLAALWKQKTKKVGFVFNLDKHDERGSHWVAAYVGLNPKCSNYGVHYYDSVSMAPPREIAAWMKNIAKQLAALHRSATRPPVQINKKRRQYKGSECGVFAMLFIILMMRHSFASVVQNMGYDDDVFKYRNVLFRPAAATTPS